MSDRFYEWIALTAKQNDLRVQMLILAALGLGLYYAINLWPIRLRPVGKAAIIVTGGVIYVGLFIFALWTLGWALALGR